MENEVNFFPLLVVSLLAVTVPIVLHRIPRVAIPIVVGEILAGIVVGPNGLDLIRGFNPNLEFLKLFGFTYLMFLSGLEIDFDLLGGYQESSARGPRAFVKSPLGMGLLSFGVTLLVATACSLLVIQWGLASNLFVMALVLSTTSLGVVAPVLRERGLIRSLLGQYILVSAVIGDLATVMLISVYVVLHTQGLELEVMFVLLLLVATFAVYRLAKISRRHLPLEELVDELSHATAQLDTRGALALAVVFIALAQGLGVEVILGAFLAGAIVSLLSSEEGSTLRPKLHAIGYGFFIPIFFILVGVDFDLAGLLESPRGWTLVPALLLMAYGVKYAAALPYRWLFGWREVFALGTLNSSRLSLIIAVAAIGVEIGAITPTTDAAIIIIAIVTVVVSPTVFSRVVPAVERVRRKVIVAGSGPHARLLADRLRQHGESVTVLTRNDAWARELDDLGVTAVKVSEHGRVEDLETAGISDSAALVSLLADVDQSLRLTELARERFGVEQVLAHVESPRDHDRFQEAGVTVVDPSLSTVVVLEAMVRHPHAFSLIAELDISRDVADVRLHRTTFHGRRLRNVPLPGDALVLLIVREGEVVIPRGNTELQRGDVLTVVGSKEAVDLAVDYLNK